MRKKLWKICTAAVASVFLCLTALPVDTLWAATENEKYLQEARTIQEEIISWKCDVEGEKELLAGSLLDGAGSAGSDWFAFDISRMGKEDQQAAYLSRLKDAVETMYIDKEDSKVRYRVSDFHRIAMTILACGGDPENFGTDPDGNPINLINDTVWNCIWGDMGNQGINGYIWALLTVDSGNFQEPEDAAWTRERIISELLARQLADGGFGLIKTDPSDVDLTSMTLTALAPYREEEKSYTVTNIVTEEEVTLTVAEMGEKAFACLSDLQNEDGSMLTYGEPTSESTSWAMMALASWGRDLQNDEAFIKNGKTLLDGIKLFCMPDGGVLHGLAEDEAVASNMAAYQAVYGLEAACRFWEGRQGVFDLTDAKQISDEEIEEAGKDLPELSNQQDERSSEEVEEEIGNRMVYLTAGIAGAIVVVVIIFLFLLLKDGKKKKEAGKDDDDFDDEW